MLQSKKEFNIRDRAFQPKTTSVFNKNIYHEGEKGVCWENGLVLKHCVKNNKTKYFYNDRLSKVRDNVKKA